MRYPIFLLALGPPIFRSGAGIDATKGVIDFWAVLQVAWIGLIAIRAMKRLAFAQSILIPKQVRSILRLLFILGFLFVASAEYSPGRLVSAAYAILYLLTVICMAEFIADTYKNPIDWMQVIFHFRTIFFLLFILVIITIFFDPGIVLYVLPGVGIRLVGGTVAPVAVICPFMAIISSYAFLFSLESKTRSVFFFVVGLLGTLSVQSRGGMLALLTSLALIGIIWAGTGKRNSYLFIASSFASVILAGVVLAVVGGGRVWNTFNRGQSLEGIQSASGRTDVWKFVIHYCLAHPLGMGYVAGFRMIFQKYFVLGLQLEVAHVGNTHNSFIDALAAAGWPALTVYLFLLVKIFLLGWRYSRKQAIFSSASEDITRHVLCCTMALLVFCMVCGMDASDFAIPMRAAFYFQNLIIAMILGMSARLLAASRARAIEPVA